MDSCVINKLHKTKIETALYLSQTLRKSQKKTEFFVIYPRTRNTLFWDFKCSSSNIIKPPARDCARECPRCFELSSTCSVGDRQSHSLELEA